MEERGVDIHRNYQFRLGPGNAKWVLIVLLVVVVALAILCAQPAAAQAYSAEEAQFLVLINQYRAQNGLQPLLVSDVITVACYRHNSDMAKYSFFDHSSLQSDYYPPGAAPWDRMRAEGYNYNTYMGENIAAGYATAAAVFEAWRNSPGHNANMLGANFKVIGISLKEVPGSHYRYYWTTDFGGYVDPSAHTIGGGTPPPPPDTTPPSVSITAPQEGATVSGYAVPINVNAVDNVGVTKVELYIDSILVATDNSAPYAFTWNTLGGSDGPRRLTAKAFDAAGNTSISSPVNVTVRNQVTTTTTTQATTTTTHATTTTTQATTTTTQLTTTTTSPTSTTTTTPATTTTSSATTTTTVRIGVTTTTAPPTTTTTNTPRSPVFIDVPPSDAYYSAVAKMKEAQVIEGYPGEAGVEFRPDNPVNRAQFAKMIVGASGIEACEQHRCRFRDMLDDTPDSLFPHNYVAVAAELGIVLGRPDGTFGPWDEITRCNVVAMVIRAARQLQPGRLADPPAQYVGSFSPTGWPEQDANLRLAEYNGLLQGLKGFGSHWSPWQCATRGEVAHILAKLMN